MFIWSGVDWYVIPTPPSPVHASFFLFLDYSCSFDLFYALFYSTYYYYGSFFLNFSPFSGFENALAIMAGSCGTADILETPDTRRDTRRSSWNVLFQLVITLSSCFSNSAPVLGYQKSSLGPVWSVGKTLSYLRESSHWKLRCYELWIQCWCWGFLPVVICDRQCCWTLFRVATLQHLHRDPLDNKQLNFLNISQGGSMALHVILKCSVLFKT